MDKCYNLFPTLVGTSHVCCSLYVCLAEEYKLLVEKREIIRNDFHDKMVDASKV